MSAEVAGARAPGAGGARPTRSAGGAGAPASPAPAPTMASACERWAGSDPMKTAVAELAVLGGAACLRRAAPRRPAERRRPRGDPGGDRRGARRSLAEQQRRKLEAFERGSPSGSAASTASPPATRRWGCRSRCGRWAIEGEVVLPALTFVATAHAVAWERSDPGLRRRRPRDALHGAGGGGRRGSARRPGRCSASTSGAGAPTSRGWRRWPGSAGCRCSSTPPTRSAATATAGRWPPSATPPCSASTRPRSPTPSRAARSSPPTAELAERAATMRNFGFVDEDEIVGLGTNAKLSEAGAAMGLASLDALDGFLAASRAQLRRLRGGAGGRPGRRRCSPSTRPRAPTATTSSSTSTRATPASTATQLRAVLVAENVLARRYFYPGCHRVPPYDRRAAAAAAGHRARPRPLPLAADRDRGHARGRGGGRRADQAGALPARCRPRRPRGLAPAWVSWSRSLAVDGRGGRLGAAARRQRRHPDRRPAPLRPRGRDRRLGARARGGGDGGRGRPRRRGAGAGGDRPAACRHRRRLPGRRGRRQCRLRARGRGRPAPAADRARGAGGHRRGDGPGRAPAPAPLLARRAGTDARRWSASSSPATPTRGTSRRPCASLGRPALLH